MLGDGHVRFGGRAEETDQPQGWHRASARPYAGNDHAARSTSRRSVATASSPRTSWPA
jgi:hypothetical protein